MAILPQLVATGIISYISITMGIIFTLPSAVLQLFSSENTTLNRVMTETEISLLGSISYISSLIIIPFCGYLLDALGRKKLGCVILVSVYTVEAFLFAMFLCGPCGCTTLAIPVYVSEFCQENIRGSMTTISFTFYGFGMLLSYIFGGVLAYSTIIYLMLSMSAIGLAMLCVIKESPLFLIKKNREKEAAKSIAFFRGWKHDSKEVKEEIENIRRILSIEVDSETSPEEENLKGENKQKQKFNVLSYLGKSRSSRRALFVLLIVYTTSIFQGMIIVQVYAAPVLEVAVPSMSATLSSVLITVFTIIGGFLGAYLVDAIGRRPLLIFSSIATGFCCVILGTQLHLVWGSDWLTAVFMHIYGITYSVGAGCVPCVLIGEVFLPEIKSFASMLCIEWSSICSFIILFIFNPMIKAVGLGPLFYIFSASSFLAALFCCFYLPETNGLPVDEIQEKFLQKKK